jgi:hypothetical protein
MRYAHIGWCHEDNHDKVWGAICLQEPYSTWHTDGKFVTFWGRRGKKLQTKIVDGSNYEINKMFNKKLDKGYQSVDKQRLDQVYPEFEEDLEKTAVWAMLAG